MYSLGLKRHRNFKEYWVCATCHRPRRNRSLEVCHLCKSDALPILEITQTRTRGDFAGDASHRSREMFKLAKDVKSKLSLHYHRSPAKFVLDSVREYRKPEQSDLWYCTFFYGREKFSGELDRDISFMSVPKEVRDSMSKKKIVQIRLDTDLHRWLKTYAAEKGVTMTDIIKNYIRYIKAKSDKSIEVDQI